MHQVMRTEIKLRAILFNAKILQVNTVPQLSPNVGGWEEWAEGWT